MVKNGDHDPIDALSTRTLKALTRLTSTISRVSTVLAICQAAIRAIEEATGVARCSALLLDASATMHFIAWRGISDEYRAAVDGHSPWAADTYDATPIFIRDVDADPAMAPFLESFHREGIRAIAFVPLNVRGRLLGKFMMYWNEPHEIEPDERAAALGIAERTALGIDHLRAEEEVRRSRDQLATILRGMTDGVTAQDPSGAIVFANPAAAALIGFDSVEELLATPPTEMVAKFELYGENGAPMSPADLPGRHALRGEATHPSLIRFRVRATGEERWSIVSAAPIFDANGGVTLAINIFRDVTEIRRADERERFLASAGELLSSSLDYETTLQSIARLAVRLIADWCRIDLVAEDGLVRTIAVEHRDPAKVKWANEVRQRFPETQARTGVFRVIETHKSELYPVITDEMLQSAADPEYLELLRHLGLSAAMLVPLMAQDRALGVITLIASDSERRYTEADLAFAEELARRAATAIDNAQLYRHEQEARQREAAARTEAEEANRAKDEFLATLSHELRTPLTSVLGWSRMLTSMDVDGETARTGLEAIARSAEAQARIVDDLLDVSQIIKGKLRLEMKPTKLREVVEQAIAAVRPMAEAKGVAISASLTDVVMIGDADRLQQVVWNLLTNAVKFTPAGGAVVITAASDDRTITLTVRDTGAGIAPDLLPHIFERFRQGDSSSTRRFGGLGLGLAIVKALIEAHGGSVSASSGGTGTGATFTIRLPATEARAATTGAGSSHERTLDGQRILVVDDERESREFVTSLLAAVGADARGAADVESALLLFRQWRPDVVISDLAIPVQDGFSLIRAIRSGSERTDVPAIALTAYGRPEDRDVALRSGFTSYVRKPIEPAAFLTEVSSLVRR